MTLSQFYNIQTIQILKDEHFCYRQKLQNCKTFNWTKQWNVFKYYVGGGNLRGTEANVLDCSLEVNEFELHSRYYIHFRTKNSQGKYKIPLWVK